MSINKFYPTSPDLNITTDSDMTVAKFGHLNRLVEDINAGGGGGGGGGVIDVGQGTASTIRIDVGNQAFGQYGSALSGFTNITCNDFTANTWGRNNIAHGCYSSVNGTSNIVIARNSHILSGTNNTIACDATQSAWNTQSSYSGNYIQNITLPDGGGIVCGRVNNVDSTSFFNAGDTFSVNMSYASGCTETGSAYSQIQMVNVPIICSEYVAPHTYLYFCYDSTSPSFIGTYRCEFGTGSTYSCGYIQKTGTFSSYSTYEASNHPNTIAGGAFNTITGYTSATTISGGYQNTISGGYATIGGGNYNYIESGRHDFIGGAFNSKLVNADNSVIAGGYGHCILNSQRSFIGGGLQHKICDGNTAFSVIVGGYINTITTDSEASGILGGFQNVICNSPRTFIIGSNITADRQCTTFVNNLSIKNIPTASAGLPSGSVWSNSGILTIVP
jgi:hypothetical protein